ncbi:voltage-dependent t-type calcium channel subunit alpha [Biomphalaria glabrata]|uniref:Uncharacterized protein LOC106055922 n=1 Tax=Biomphalaria glabrata TaxID=6526 RepID=A0A2C9LIP2_BIOGL|nr:uncharacterized protein LOC106055922 [Biomphalaria glabrata]XP_013067881.1 uncharacterized protein LOC106055922 [Biomphalaria glabrata]XP_055877044.1 uncharacterized protein LOC106055922 [Biomphalaria glabrata]KAI8765074.1 voltage-dependent T-type calcium channel alpha-1 subunit isoform D [Biomphalaria glabrata]KAI8797047.1 voltage-dependent T-type calcium channel alpha-1 subunit isoform D [Biomphalaria glabrata]
MAEESSGAGYMPVRVIVERAGEDSNNDTDTMASGAYTEADAPLSECAGASGHCEASAENADDAVLFQEVTNTSASNEQQNTNQSAKKPGDLDAELGDVVQQGLEDTGPDQSQSQPVDQQNDGDQEEELLFPGFVPKTFYFLTQRNRLRFWCLRCITWPYPFHDISSK